MPVKRMGRRKGCVIWTARPNHYLPPDYQAQGITRSPRWTRLDRHWDRQNTSAGADARQPPWGVCGGLTYLARNPVGRDGHGICRIAAALEHSLDLSDRALSW